MFSSSSRVTVFSVSSTYTLTSLDLLATSSTYFSTHVGLKGLLLFYRIWSCFFSLRWLIYFVIVLNWFLLPASFSSMVIKYFEIFTQKWRHRLFWLRHYQFLLIFALFGHCRHNLCSISFSASNVFSWDLFISLVVDFLLLE